jgi:fluoroacetyl-CoA thioesterase
MGGILVEIHYIPVGLSTIHKREGSVREKYIYSGSNDSLGYLLSTPEVLDIIIEASVKMLDPLLPPGYITVGKYIELSHEQPTLTLAGGAITTILTVTEVSGNKVFLDFSCHDEIGLICRGVYERVIVSREKLMEATFRRAQSKN